MNEKQVKRYPLSRQVADQLEKMISDGVYKVGDKIPTEPELTQMFSVSRNTLREAIQSLTSAGILQVKQGDGTYVCADNRFHANMSKEYDQASLPDILEARNVLEAAIAMLAAQRRTEEDLQQIYKALISRQELVDSEKEDSGADIRFHMTIARACHNQIMEDLYSSLSEYLESHVAERLEKTTLNTEQIDLLHEKLYVAIRDGQPDTAHVCAQNILKI